MPPFINPWMLLGLGAISVPIIIHLMNRFRYRDVDWAAMDLLRKVLVVRSRRIRLEDLILLLLRCAIIALLALAIARPTLRSEGGAGGGKADVGAVIAIDASFSMDHKPGVYSRFDRALQRTDEVLKTLNPGDPVTVVLLGDRPRVLFRNSGFEAERLSAVLEKAAPLPERLNLDICLTEVEELMAEIKAPARECYLVTDAQTVNWGQLTESSRAALERIATLGRVYYLPLAGGQSENLTITRFEQESGMIRQGGLARYVTAVSNSGQKAVERVTVTLYKGEDVVDQRILPKIEPGNTELVPMFVRFDEPGAIRLTARIGTDHLPIDNARYAVANVRPQVRILCVEGSPSTDSTSSEVHYLLTSLSPGRTRKTDDPVSIDRVEWLDMSSRRLTDYDVVLLVDVPEVSEEQATAIGQFVSAGGGLITFLGPNIQSDVLNNSLQFQGKPLLPGTILEAVGDAADPKLGKTIEPVEGHALARGLAGLPKVLLNQPRVRRFFPIELAAGGRAVVKLGSEPTEILVAEKALGRGSVVLFSSSADRTWTDIVSHPTYPILLNETITYLGRQNYERSLLVSEPLTLPLPVPVTTAGMENVICIVPEDGERTVKTVRRDGQILAELGPTERAGFYEVRYGEEGVVPVGVNVNPTESNVRCLDDRTIDETLQGTKVTVVPEANDLASAIRQGRVGREIWWELLLAALVLLLVEAYLAYRFTRSLAANADSSQSGLGNPLTASSQTKSRDNAYDVHPVRA